MCFKRMAKKWSVVSALVIASCILLVASRAGAQDIYVYNYGAVVNDSNDDSTSVQNAINAASTGDRILFDAGIYDLSSSNLVNGAVLNILQKSGITLIGSNPLSPAVLLLDGMDGSFFNVDNCNGVSFENIELDSQRPAFSQGTISARGTLGNGNKYIDLALETPFSLDTGLKVKVIRKIQTYNGSVLYTQNPFTVSYRENGYIPNGNVGFDTSIQGALLRIEIPVATDPSCVTFYSGTFNDDLTVGTRLSLMHRVYDYSGLNIEDSDNISFKDFDIYLCNGIGVRVKRGENLSFDNFTFTKLTGHVATTCADGIQTEDFAGDIIIDNCYLSGTCDDAIAVHNKFLYVQSVGQGSSFVAFWGVAGPRRPEAGEQFDVFTEYGVKKGVGTFSSVQYINGTYTMSAAITYESGFSSLAADDIIDILDRIPGSVEITDSTFEELRGRGMLLRTRNATVDNCVFRRTTGPAVYMSPSFYVWNSASVPQDITVKNCRTYLCPYWHDYSEATLVLKAELEDGSSGPSSLCSNITIRDNTFNSSPNSLMYLASNWNIVVTNNIMYGCGLNPLAENGDAAIFFDNADNVTLTINRYLSGDAPATVRWTDNCSDLNVGGNSGVLHDNPPF